MLMPLGVIQRASAFPFKGWGEFQIINAAGGVERRVPFYTVGGNVNLYSHYGEQYGVSLKKTKTELTCDPAIPLLCVYLEKSMI